MEQALVACVLVINKAEQQRDHVLFINADREFKEGKNQNKLRPEDLGKNCLHLPTQKRNTQIQQVGG
ncbi:MAG: N-6 DNA methylase [Saprospirales bacterium]|nr:N-6 DNA methylase [Saprospirales bacterium]